MISRREIYTIFPINQNYHISHNFCMVFLSLYLSTGRNMWGFKGNWFLITIGINERVGIY